MLLRINLKKKKIVLYMSNQIKQIDLLNRNSLIELATRLQITGHNNKFMSPYRTKEFLKNAIITNIKNRKKQMRKNNSTSSIKHTESGNSDAKGTQPRRILRSNSLPNLNQNNINHIYKNNIKLAASENSCIFPPQARLVAIGDIHGDLSLAIRSLKLANVISLDIPDNITDLKRINWTGGNTFVVQLGDQIDRVRPSKLFNSLCTEDDEDLFEDEGSDLKIIYLFEKLNLQAQQCNGALISILGNHELMNVDGDFRYVSPKEFREFGNRFNGKLEYNSSLPYGYKERKEAFVPGGVISKKMATTRYSIIQVGKWLFVHGGITGEIAQSYSLQKINEHIRRWLLGDTSGENMHHVHNLYHRDDDEHSPFWSRLYSDMDEWGQDALIEFKKTLNHINVWNGKNNDWRAGGIVMGHSPQFMYNRGINSSLNNRIWRVDVGASRAFGQLYEETKHNRLAQVLVIKNDGNTSNDFEIIRERG